MFVLFCACDVMNVLSVKKKENLQQKKNKKKIFTMLVSFKRNTKTDATSGTGAANYSVTPERGVQ